MFSTTTNPTPTSKNPIMASNEPNHEHRAPAATGAQVAPMVMLEKCKLYRLEKDGNPWEEKGVGTVKLLKHKETRKVRLIMRESKTHKICANHLVLPTMTVQ